MICLVSRHIKSRCRLHYTVEVAGRTLSSSHQHDVQLMLAFPWPSSRYVCNKSVYTLHMLFLHHACPHGWESHQDDTSTLDGNVFAGGAVPDILQNLPRENVQISLSYRPHTRQYYSQYFIPTVARDVPSVRGVTNLIQS